MAHAIFNISPVRFFSSLQDNVHTFTNSATSKVNKTNNEKNSQNSRNENDTLQQSEINKSYNVNIQNVTLQLTLPVDIDNNNENNNIENINNLLLQASNPIDIPRSIPVNIPNNNDKVSATIGSFNSNNSSFFNQDRLLIQENPSYLQNDELSAYFNSLAVQSPTGTSVNDQYNVQQINTPLNIGSPQSPSFLNTNLVNNQAYYGSPQSPSFINTNEVYGSPQSPNLLNSNLSGQYVTSNPQSPLFLNTNEIYSSSQSPNLLNSNLSGQYVTSNPQSPLFLNTNYSCLSPSSHYVGSPSNPTFFAGHSYQTQNSFLDETNPNLLSSPPFHASHSSYLGSPYQATHSPLFQASQSYVGSPNSSHFLNSPIITTSYVFDNLDHHTHPTQTPHDLSNYLSPSLSATHPSPLNSPSPTGSFVETSFLFPPAPSAQQIECPRSPVPKDIPLTTDQDYHNYLKSACNQPETHVSTHDSVVPVSPQLAQPHEPKKTIRKSTVRIMTPSGRKAKIHRCPVCGHSSNRANNMREHILIHDPSRPKPFVCNLCFRSFARKHDMNRHYLSCKCPKKTARFKKKRKT